MTIIQVNCGSDAGVRDPDALLGRYTTLTGWSEALVEAGARVRVVQRFRHETTIVRNGVHYVFCPRGRTRANVLRSTADLVHVNGLVFSTCAWWLRRALPERTAIVMQDHGTTVRPPADIVRRMSRRLRRLELRAADAFLFVSADQAIPWRAAGLIAAGQPVYEVMEAGTAVRPLPRAVARAASGVDGDPAVLWVGRLNENKDPLTVLSGFERALGDVPGAVLSMVYAEDDLLPLVRERLDQSPALSARVRLVGAIPHRDIAAYLSAADLFVCGSHHEGSGYALIEACACGAVPVVTDIPSFRAITNHGAFGALWTPGSASGFARALVDVWRRDRSALRSRAVEHAARRLSWPAVGRRAMAVYSDIVARRRAGSEFEQPPLAAATGGSA
ncbi:MAG: glycosyltransferase family 4 protein [Betaproteobacteria bacterium]